MRHARSLTVIVIIVVAVWGSFSALDFASPPVSIAKSNPITDITTYGSNSTLYRNVTFDIHGSTVTYMVTLSVPSNEYQIGTSVGGGGQVFETGENLSFPATYTSVYLDHLSMTNASYLKDSLTGAAILGHKYYDYSVGFSLPSAGTYNITVSFDVVPVISYGIYHFSFPGKQVTFNMIIIGTDSPM